MTELAASSPMTGVTSSAGQEIEDVSLDADDDEELARALAMSRGEDVEMDEGGEDDEVGLAVSRLLHTLMTTIGRRDQEGYRSQFTR